MITKPKPSAVEEFQRKAKAEFDLDLSFEDAEKMMQEIDGETQARERR
jgi:hypothetical protein